MVSVKRFIALTGVPRATLYSWLKQGVIAGIPSRVKGQRYPRYTARHLTFFRLAAAMRGHHFGLDDIRDALQVLDAHWNGRPPGQLLADRLGWTFAQRFLVEVDGQPPPLVAAPPVLWDVGRILASVLAELDELEATNASDGGN